MLNIRFTKFKCAYTLFPSNYIFALNSISFLPEKSLSIALFLIFKKNLSVLVWERLRENSNLPVTNNVRQIDSSLPIGHTVVLYTVIHYNCDVQI